jgi:hypothetical protein
MKTIITTHSGSRYTVREEEGRFWLSGPNVPNDQSVPIPEEREWEIQKPMPWPAVVGERLLMYSTFYGQAEHPERLPGGGKWTSPVETIES